MRVVLSRLCACSAIGGCLFLSHVGQLYYFYLVPLPHTLGIVLCLGLKKLGNDLWSGHHVVPRYRVKHVIIPFRTIAVD